MRCIEIAIYDFFATDKYKININMRCIEILKLQFVEICQNRLTLTWDVLKLLSYHRVKGYVMININMRCIEIFLLYDCMVLQIRLTLTWDVLKYNCCTI